MLERLPENVRTPRVARAVVSPSALLLAGAGTAAAILGGLPLVAAAGIGALAWGARVAVAAIPRGPRPERIDPFRVGEPWRSYVQDAQQAKTKFDNTTKRMRTGPLRERLEGIGARLDDGVRECWTIAQEGHDLAGAYRQLDVRDAEAELAGLRQDLRNTQGADRRASLQRAITAVEAQLESANRIRDVAENASDRLKVLNAQLDEAVARAVELSVRARDVTDLTPLTDDVDNLVNELEALRQGMEETGGAARGMTA